MESTAITEITQSPIQHSLNPQAILKAPSSERPNKIAELKAELTTTIKNAVGIVGKLANTIRYYPDTPKGDLLSYFERVSAKTPLSPIQRELISKGLDVYHQRHQVVKQTRAEHPDNNELFAFLFGQEPRGRIEVIEGPITLYFRCHNPNDYALIHSGAFLEKRRATDKEFARANRSGGIMIKYPRPALQCSITAENAKKSPFDEFAKETFTHEEQHAIQNLFTQALRNYQSELLNSNQPVPQFLKDTTPNSPQLKSHATLKILKGDLQAQSETNRKLLIRHFLSSVLKMLRPDLQSQSRANQEAQIKRLLRSEARYVAETSTKDEMLAYYKEGEDPQTIEHILTKPTNKKGLYDFFDTKYRQDITETLVKAVGEDLRPLVTKSIENVFVTEYKYKILSDGIDALCTLEQSGFTKEQIVHLLMGIPYSKWKKEAIRLTKDQDEKIVPFPQLQKAA